MRTSPRGSRPSSSFHVYWLFKEIWYFDDDAERNEAKWLSNQFQRTLTHRAKDQYGWNLDLTDDLVRLLRVSGTSKFKNCPVPVKIVEQINYRYEPDDFEQRMRRKPIDVCLNCLLTSLFHGENPVPAVVYPWPVHALLISRACLCPQVVMPPQSGNSNYGAMYWSARQVCTVRERRG